MSTYVVDWVIAQAPTADIKEFAVLAAMAARTDHDGCGAFVSVAKIARAAHCDKRTVYRTLAALKERRIIAPGDPSSPGADRWRRKSKPGQTTVLYDILVPAEWYSAQMLADFNEDREECGRDPITAENRPPIAPPPPDAGRQRRSDAGKKRASRKKPPAE